MDPYGQIRAVFDDEPDKVKRDEDIQRYLDELRREENEQLATHERIIHNDIAERLRRESSSD